MAIKTVYLRSNGGETVAYEDQVTAGLWHIPPKATEVEPPSFTEKQTCQFIDDKWVVTDIPEPEPEPEPYVLTYADKRRIAFGSIGDQLDMLFHDMTAGKGSKTGEWYKAVAKVKSDISKSD
tara:strand:- start:232 stop:597 length:366 start_codon:yes stop_codon:yes gene_type:complete